MSGAPTQKQAMMILGAIVLGATSVLGIIFFGAYKLFS